jgi:hypothetical protein
MATPISAEPPASQSASQQNDETPQPEAPPQTRSHKFLEILYLQVLERRAANPHPKLNEAFRTAGLDEHMLAAHYRHTLDVLTIKLAEGESVEKVLVDYLKECRNVLDPPRAASSNSSSDGAPVSVTLVHSVDRPVRSGFDSPQDPPPTAFSDEDPRAGFPAL